ncbi:MAG: DMT family protein [Bacteriovoracaceae bacterium]
MLLRTITLLTFSNLFMCIAWYGHLKSFKESSLLIAILVSWGIALFEYILQVPANRYGAQVMSLGQLKVLQEVITMAIFPLFAYFYMRQPLKLDFLWAGLCLIGAAFFMFRK